MSDGTLLVVKTHAFGDAMLATPAVRELVASNADCRWLALCGPSAAPVWQRFPGLARIHVAPFPPCGSAGRFRLMVWSVRARSRLRSVRKAWVFHPSPEVRKWVRFLTGSEVISGGNTPLGGWEEARGFDPARFAGESYAAIAGVSPNSWIPEFPILQEELDSAEQLLSDGRWVAIAPGGGENPRDTVFRKRWGVEGFREVARRLTAMDYGVLLLGGAGDSRVAGEITGSLAGLPGRILDMTGRTGWGETAALLRVCGRFAGNDSGTAHAAVAAGARSVVIFGPTDPDALYPQDSIVPVVSAAGCAPCYSNALFPGCTGEGRDCMLSVDTEDVWAAIERILDEGNGS